MDLNAIDLVVASSRTAIAFTSAPWSREIVHRQHAPRHGPRSPRITGTEVISPGNAEVLHQPVCYPDPTTTAWAVLGEAQLLTATLTSQIFTLSVLP